jgi:hypothetical protein
VVPARVGPYGRESAPRPSSVAEPVRRGSLAPSESARLAFGAARIPALQHAVGNRAVVGLLRASPPSISVQRTAIVVPAQLSSASGDFAAVLGAVGAYNLLADDDFTERMNALDGIDTAVHAWFSAHPSPGLEDAPRQALKDLLALSDGEHKTIVRAAKSDPTVIPVALGRLSGEQRLEVRRLWAELAGVTDSAAVGTDPHLAPGVGQERRGQGGLQVLGGGDFVDSTLTKLAKLLALPTGLNMITFLNDEARTLADDEKIIILDELPVPYRAVEAGHRSESSYAISQKAARDKDSTDKSHELRHQGGAVVGPAPTPVANPQELLDVALDRRRLAPSGAIGIGADRYQLGGGTGSFVKLSEAHGADAGLHLGGRGGEAVLNPGHVTLGHELGHAAKMRAGALVPAADRDVFPAFGVDSEPEQQLWTNPEELANIEGVENALRTEGGMTPRQYHKPRETVLQRRRLASTRAPLEALMRQDSWITLDLAFDALRKKLSRLAGTLHDDAAFGTLRDEVQAFVAGYDHAATEAPKRARITEELDGLRRKYGVWKADWQKRWDATWVMTGGLKTEQVRVDAVFAQADDLTVDRVGTLAAWGLDITPTLDRIRTIRLGIPAPGGG